MHRGVFLFTLSTIAGVSGLSGATGHAISQEVPGSESPFVGSWTADLSRSQLADGQTFQASTLRFAVADDTVAITHRTVLASGRTDEGTTTYQTDRQEEPVGPAATFVARWHGSHILEMVAEVDGQELGRATYEVSADGKTLTVTTSSKDASGGDTESVIVLDRS